MKFNEILKIALSICLFLAHFCAIAQRASISPIFSDNMVIQRDQALVVWGSGSPNDIVTIGFQNDSKSTKIDESGQWKIKLAPPTIGGPYELTFNDIKIKNIFVGDVWMAGGQSNMEWPMKSTDGFQEELIKDDFRNIRFFKLPRTMDNRLNWDVSGGEWQAVDAENLGAISGIAYFFAKKLEQETGVTIGIVDHSWGGSDIEGWMPIELFENDKDWKEIVSSFKSKIINPEQDAKARADWYENMDSNDIGATQKWQLQSSFNDWDNFNVPGKWESNGYPNKDGIFYFTKAIELPEKANQCVLSLGPIDDSDITYWNGIKIGEMENAYDVDRKYNIPNELLKTTNNLVVRVRDNGGGGGICGVPEQIYMLCNQDTFDLAGSWKIKIGTPTYPPRPENLTLNNLPSNRYNAMVNPLFKYGITGMIWYQGESNTGRSDAYSTHFRNMILDYRKKWNQEFPFLFVQLANYNQEQDPSDSGWAEIRAAQASVLDLPKTALATAIDLGNPDDIHPRNKKDVGLRLANAALAIQYGKEVEYKNPTLESFVVEKDIVMIKFKDYGENFKEVAYGIVQGFHIKTADGLFSKVRAQKSNNFVIVYLEGNAATELYYAWADNPGTLNLFSNHGLPVLPFKINLKP